ncbi:MAG: HTTM domain-containing protein, partial [Actinomycetota bacterium]|nr:HTTM domain-containing protein [Actinomycetota bacterium]
MRTSETNASWQFGAFSLLFACSLILHQMWWGGFEVLSPHFVVVAAALWAAARPRSVARFVAMLAAEVGSVALDMPGVGSHTVLVLVCGTCVLAYVGAVSWRSRRLPEAGALFAAIAPFLRAQLLLVYAAAALAKMNTGFVDADISCAAWMSAKIAWFDPSLLGSWRVVPAVWGTLLIEVTLPVLLAVRRTRMAAVALGAAFHLVLALAGNVPFSALALAFYVAFLPADVPRRLGALVTPHRPAASSLRF